MHLRNSYRCFYKQGNTFMIDDKIEYAKIYTQAKLTRNNVIATTLTTTKQTGNINRMVCMCDLIVILNLITIKSIVCIKLK